MFNDKFKQQDGKKIHLFTCMLMALVIGIYVALHFIKDYATFDGKEGSLHDAKCHAGDSMDCHGRLIGIQVTNGMAAGFAFVAFVFYMVKFMSSSDPLNPSQGMVSGLLSCVPCGGSNWHQAPPIFWMILISMSSSLTSFFLWVSVNQRIYFQDGANTWHQHDLQDGKMFALSISGMVGSFLMLLSWISYECYYDNNRERISAFWVRDVAGRLFSVIPNKSVNAFGEMLVYHAGYGIGPNSVTKEEFAKDNDKDGPL